MKENILNTKLAKTKVKTNNGASKGMHEGRIKEAMNDKMNELQERN